MSRRSGRPALLARWSIAAASRLVPAARRAEWRERWHAELEALDSADNAKQAISPLSLARGTWMDAIAERGLAFSLRALLRGVSHDIRLSLRSIRRQPAGAFFIVLITGLGAAAATSIFVLVDAVFIRPLPGLVSPNDLLLVGRGDSGVFDNFSYPNYVDLKQGLADNVALAAFASVEVVAGAGRNAQVVPAQIVTDSYFDVAGMRVSNGRGITLDTSAERVAVLSDWYYRRHIAAGGGDTLVVGGQAVRIAGRAPAGFAGMSVGTAKPAMWLSVSNASAAAARLSERNTSWLWIVGRRSVGFEEARAAVTAVHARLAAEHPQSAGSSITVVDGVGLRPQDRREAVRISSLLIAGAILVWLVAAANGAGLHLTRAMAGLRQTAVKMALGASRLRILRAFLIEQALLSATGGLFAWIVSHWAIVALENALPYELAVPLAADSRALGFAVFAAGAVGVLVSAIPLWSATSTNVITTLKHDRRSGLGHSGRASLVLLSLQLALSTALLSSTALLAQSLRMANAATPGFDPRGVVVASVRPQMPLRPLDGLRDALRNAARSVPGVVEVGLTTGLPLGSNQRSRSIFPSGSEYLPDGRPISVITDYVDKGFFDALGITFQNGRPMSGGIAATAPIPVVVSKTAAGRLWPDNNTDRHLAIGSMDVHVVGIVADVQQRSLREASSSSMFFPIDGTNEFPSYVVVRTSASAKDAVPALRQALSSVSDVMVGSVVPYSAVVAASMGDTRMAADLAWPLAGLAALLAASGLYGVASRRGLERQHEFSVRVALGADRRAIAIAVLRQASIWTLFGVSGGMMIAAALSGTLQTLLYGVAPADPVAFGAAALTVMVIAAAAAFIPARRAARTDPSAALRGD